MTPQGELQLISILNTFMMAYVAKTFPEGEERSKLIDKLAEAHDQYLNQMKQEYPGL